MAQASKDASEHRNELIRGVHTAMAPGAGRRCCAGCAIRAVGGSWRSAGTLGSRVLRCLV
jgi:hypothetical protein